MSWVRRTQGWFRKSKARVTSKRPLPKPSWPLEDAKLQALTDKFKSSCDCDRFRYNKLVFKQYVIKLAAAKHFSLVDNILRHQKKYDDIRNEDFSSRIIYLYGLAGMVNHARKLFDELPRLNCPRTVRSFNALLNAYARSRMWGRVFYVFDELSRDDSTEPDIFSHNMLMRVRCEMGSIDDALCMLDEFESPNIVTFNTVLRALYKDREKFSEGERVWAMMKRKNVAANIKSYNARLQGMFCVDRVPDAIDLVCDMELNGFEPDSATYNALIIGFCGTGNLKEAKKWYSSLKKKKCRPNLMSSYSTLISASHVAGDLDTALDVSLDAIICGLILEPAVIKPVVEGLNNKGRTEDASKLEQMVMYIQ